MAPLPARTFCNRLSTAHLSAECSSRPAPSQLTSRLHARQSHSTASSACSSQRQGAALEQCSAASFCGSGGRRQRGVAPSAAAGTLQSPAADTDELPVQRGETAGAALVLEDITIQAGDRDLLENVSWTMMPGQRVGLVGSNGCGKSTLLRCISGYQKQDAGSLLVGHKVELGYLEQTAVSGSDRTVWQEARSRMTQINAAEAAIESAAEAMSNGHPKGGDMLQAAQDAFEAAGGFEADKRIANVLTGLGFKQTDWTKSCSEFSGGWQMRIALARLLLGPAGQSAASKDTGGVLLLDEPTNHLDNAAIKWLGNFLRTSGGGAVIVSHDEALLEAACDRIVEVRGRQLHHYVGGFASFLEQRKLREEQALSTAMSQQAEIARLEDFVARFGAKASKASQAQSRQKALEKLRAGAVEAPAASAATGAGDARKVALRLPKPPACHDQVLGLQGAEVGWGAAGQGRDPLLTGVDLKVMKGERVLVLGPNGAGKSTLLKAIAGSLPLWAGERALGEGVQLAVFSQDLAQDLPSEQPALDYVLERARENDSTIKLEAGRKALGALGLTGTMALRNIGQLSGGEKARVALAAFALVPSNLLLLDEASNHLDAQTIEVLTGALQDFGGAIIAITHNRAFAERLNATHILRVQDGGAKYSMNSGLSDADFDHETPAQSDSEDGSEGAPAAAPAPKKGGKRVKTKRAKPAAPSPHATAMGAALALANAARAETQRSPGGSSALKLKQHASAPMVQNKKGRKTGVR